ncbi:MAG: hypothetical protein HZB56_06745 [Deltaproteobacteria bacterium]|nr:hypothetical protein [Deltaproteobacteria bacterium]
MRVARLFLFATLAAALLPAAGTWAAPVDLTRADRKSGTLADGRYAPGRPAVAAFGGESPYVCPARGAPLYLAEELAVAFRGGGGPMPQADDRLCAVAESFLSWEGKDGPPAPLAAWVTQHFGLLGSFARVVTLQVTTDNREEPKEIAEKLVEPITALARGAKLPRYGLLLNRVRRGTFKVVIATLDQSPVELEAPRQLAAGQAGRIAGKLLGDLEKPKVLVADVPGKLTVAEGSGSRFEAQVACGDRPGTIRVEIRAELGGSPMVVTQFPIACGRPLDDSVAMARPADWSGDESAQARRMAEFINAERTAVGHRPLAWDDALAGVARGVAASLKTSSERGAFEVPADLVARLKREGISSQVILQSPALGSGAREVMEQLSESPGHRASFMDPSVTNVGIGIVGGKGPEGRAVVFVDQVFIKELPPLDPVATAEKLRVAVVQKRKDGRYPPAAQDTGLDEFAQTFARELAAAAGNLPKARQAELTKTLDKRFKAVSLTFGARPEPLDFAEEPEVTAPGKLFGVGVALGMNEKLGRNAVYAVIAVGQERSAGKEDAPAAPRKGKKK